MGSNSWIKKTVDKKYDYLRSRVSQNTLELIKGIAYNNTC